MKNEFTLRPELHAGKRKDGAQYIRFRLSHRGERRNFTTGFFTLPEQWDMTKCRANKKHPDAHKINAYLNRKEAEIKEFIGISDLKGRRLQLDDIAPLLLSDKQAPSGDVLAFMAELIDEMQTEQRLGNAKTYHYVECSLINYLTDGWKSQPEDGKVKKAEAKAKFEARRAKARLPFERMNYSFLKKYSIALKTIRGLNDRSLSLHFRTLRAVYYEAVRRKLADPAENPFNSFKVSQFSTKTTPRPITATEMRDLKKLELSNLEPQFDAKNYFVFSFYGCGINFVDLAQLRWADIDGRVVRYIRQKTKQPTEFMIVPEVQAILDYYEDFTGSHSSNYIFPILNTREHVTVRQIADRIEKKEKQVNRELKKIGEQIGLTKELTYYVARHTFANNMYESGMPIAVLSELLGHSSERTTRIYLESMNPQRKFAELEKHLAQVK